MAVAPLQALQWHDRERRPLESIDLRLEGLDLHLNKPEPVVICTTCRYALKPSGDGIAKHLGEKHGISTSARKGLSALMASLHLHDPNKLNLRKDGCTPHPHLHTQQGIACKRCSFRTTSRDLAKRHVSKEHGLKSGQKIWLSDYIDEDVQLQSWTQNGKRGFWIVESDGPASLHDTVVSLNTSPRRRQQVEALHEREHQRLTQPDQETWNAEDAVEDMALKNNWMRRTNWATTYAGADRQLLVRLGQTPARTGNVLELAQVEGGLVQSSAGDEQLLTDIGLACDRFFDRCEDTARHTEHSIRCWLRSQILGRPYKAPFELPGRSTTRVAYRGWFKRMIYTFLRLAHLDDQVREKRLLVQLSREQDDAAKMLWSAARRLTAGDDCVAEVLHTMPGTDMDDAQDMPPSGLTILTAPDSDLPSRKKRASFATPEPHREDPESSCTEDDSELSDWYPSDDSSPIRAALPRTQRNYAVEAHKNEGLQHQGLYTSNGNATLLLTSSSLILIFANISSCFKHNGDRYKSSGPASR